MSERLTDEQIEAQMEELTGWERKGIIIEKEYQLKDFAAAVARINQIAARADALDHHPDLCLHGWNKLKVTLSTHSVGGLTAKDFILARQIENEN